MPAKDRYHDTVKRALEKDGWEIKQDPASIRIGERFIYIDLLAENDDTEAIFIEIKGFEQTPSPITYLSNTVGQIMIYRAALDFRQIKLPVYLAVPTDIQKGLLSEPFAKHVLRYLNIKLVIYDVDTEEIIQWET